LNHLLLLFLLPRELLIPVRGCRFFFFFFFGFIVIVVLFVLLARVVRVIRFFLNLCAFRCCFRLRWLLFLPPLCLYIVFLRLFFLTFVLL